MARQIDAEALKKAINEMFDTVEVMLFDDIIATIDNAPTVENASRQGEWKVYARQGGIPITDYCTNCKYEMRWYKNKYKFCPNCGADMRKGGAEE